MCVGKFPQEREQQAARPDAKIDDAPSLCPVRHQRQCRLDQRLAIGSGNENRGRDPERQPPEFALAHDIGHRFAPDATRSELAQGLGHRGRRRIATVRDQPLDRHPGRMRQQQARLEARIVDAGGSQGDRSVAEQRVVARGP